MMNITMEATIAAPRDVVWQKFADVEHWCDWSPWLLLFDGEPGFREGERFLVQARAPLLSSCSVQFPCFVTAVEPGKLARWNGNPLGVPGYHEFAFEDAPAGCLVISRERFWNPQSVLLQAARGFFKSRVREFLDSLDAAVTGGRDSEREGIEKGARGWVLNFKTGRASR